MADSASTVSNGLTGVYPADYYAGGSGGADVSAYSSPFDWWGRFKNDLSGTTATNRFNADQAAISRQWSSDEAQKAREHELYMSNTAYQRAVADMKAAGINPASLSGMNAGGKAASTGSASATGSATASGVTGKSGVIGSLLRTAISLAILAK